jgi:hypothetical protein
MSRPHAPAHALRTRLHRHLRPALLGLAGLWLLALSPVLAAAAANDSAGIVRIWPGYRTADSFTTVGELFGGDERRGERIVRRTQLNSREGFYFLTRLRLAETLPAAEVRLELVLPASPNVVTHRFPIDLPAGEPVLHLGVTGTDWPDAESRPVAWRLRVHATASSPPLLSQQSALWTAP